MDFWKLLGFGSESEARPLGALFSELEALLKDHSQQDVKFITGFAGLLGKVAYSDREISPEELDAIKKILTEETTLSSAMYDAVLEVLERHTLELVGIEDHRYVQILNDISSAEEKRMVLDSLFSVAAANDSVSFEEDSAIGLIAKGLRLSHEDFINARQRVREHLDILKR